MSAELRQSYIHEGWQGARIIEVRLKRRVAFTILIGGRAVGVDSRAML
jgi:hypothetical protein